MLNQNSIKLKNNFIVVDEHPVVVAETIGGVMRSEEDIKREKQSRTIRTGVVKLAGHIEDSILESLSPSLTKGKLEQLVGSTVIYSVHAVETPIDVPVEGIERPLLLNIAYIIGFIEDEVEA